MTRGIFSACAFRGGGGVVYGGGPRGVAGIVVVGGKGFVAGVGGSRWLGCWVVVGRKGRFGGRVVVVVVAAGHATLLALRSL